MCVSVSVSLCIQYVCIICLPCVYVCVCHGLETREVSFPKNVPFLSSLCSLISVNFLT